MKPRGSTPPSRQARCSRSLISFFCEPDPGLALACPTESARSALTVRTDLLLPCCLPRLHLDCTVLYVGKASNALRHSTWPIQD